MYVLEQGTVVDADGSRTADVAVADGEIVAVGSIDEGTRATAETIDASGQYVAPGLIDAHVHLTMDGRPDAESAIDERVGDAAYVAAANLRDAVAAGVTTVRNLGSRDRLALSAADAVADGTVDGPRVLACGQNITMTGGHAHWFGREADGPDEVRTAVREQLKAGADVIKCMATGGVLTTGAQIGAPELNEEELAALTETAAAAGVPTAAHAHGAAGIKNAARAGITSIEHGTFMDQEAAELLADRGTVWVPTASALHGIVGADGGVIPEEVREKAERTADAFTEAFEHALDAGVTVAMGTDAGTPFNFFGEIPEEMELLVDYGLSPEAALEAATVAAAELLGIDDEVGRVAEGYRADLVVLDGDPSDDAGAWHDPAVVIADGDRVV